MNCQSLGKQFSINYPILSTQYFEKHVSMDIVVLHNSPSCHMLQYQHPLTIILQTDLVVSVQQAMSKLQYNPTPAISTNWPLSWTIQAHLFHGHRRMHFLTVWSSVLQGRFEIGAALWYASLPWHNSTELLRVTKVFKVWCLCAELGPPFQHGPIQVQPRHKPCLQFERRGTKT